MHSYIEDVEPIVNTQITSRLTYHPQAIYNYLTDFIKHVIITNDNKTGLSESRDKREGL